MKRVIFMLLVCTCCETSTAQDSLPIFNTSKNLVALSSSFDEYVARIDVEKPYRLTQVVIAVDGASANGTIEVALYGHEGGVSFPQLEKVISGPYTLRKSQEGLEFLEAHLDSGIELRNNQFFIRISKVEQGVSVLAEQSPAENMCSSSSGGDYYKLFFKKAGQWSIGNRRTLGLTLVTEPLWIPNEPYFKELTEAAGFPLTLSNRNIATADLNGDDFLDIIVGGRVYFNQKNFEFSDETDRLGFETAGLPIHPIIDINNDGAPDILLLYSDSASQKVLINQQNGNFIAQELTAMIPVRGVSSYSIADLNGDGFPDIFIGRLWTSYPSGGPDITPNYLFLNDGKGSFIDATTRIYPEGFTHRRSRGSAWCDYDNDGDLDLFVTNYFLEPDELWRNDGTGNFTDVAGSSGIDRNKFNQSSHGTGVDWGDYDQDGNFDLLVPMFAHPAFSIQYDHLSTQLYKNTGAPSYLFNRATASSGIEYEETHAGGAWGDIDNDGDLDFAISTFYGCRYMDMYVQEEIGKFRLVSKEAGISDIVSGEDVCWADWDNDGKLDMGIGEGGKFRIWKNTHPSWENHWTEIELKQQNGQNMAIGARVEVYVGGKMLLQEVTAGRGVRMQKPARLHFGLKENSMIDSVRVRWVGEQAFESFTGVQADALNYLVQGGQIIQQTDEITVNAELYIYPNPSHSALGMTLYLNQSLNELMVIYSVQGQRMMEIKFEEGKAQLQHQLAPGTYLIRRKSGGSLRFSVVP